jgi:hypothetical protein
VTDSQPEARETGESLTAREVGEALEAAVFYVYPPAHSAVLERLVREWCGQATEIDALRARIAELEALAVAAEARAVEVEGERERRGEER